MSRTTITVGATPPAFTGHGYYMDGRTGTIRPVTLHLDEAGRRLELSGADARWPYEQIRELRDQAGGDLAILRRADDPLARLIVPAAEDLRIIRTRARSIRRVPRATGLGRVAAWAVAAIAAVALIVFLLVPLLADRLATYLPPEGERALGEATFAQVRNALGDEVDGPLRICRGAEGRAALDALSARLQDHANLPVAPTIEVLDHEMVNAFALPGGYVIFFDGLLQEAGSAEEVAAVMAHEMGHLENRDPTRMALRSAGSVGVLGLLLGDFAGGAVVLFLTNQLIQAEYSREAETAADTYAHDLLRAADLPPAAMATFFERLMAEEDPAEAGILRHFLSHPAPDDRIAAARAATPGQATFEPALTASQWQAIREMCDT